MSFSTKFFIEWITGLSPYPWYLTDTTLENFFVRIWKKHRYDDDRHPKTGCPRSGSETKNLKKNSLPTMLWIDTEPEVLRTEDDFHSLIFRAVTINYIPESVITGLVRLVVNGALDIFVPVGLPGMAPTDYITRIGRCYLMIPAMVIAAGIIAEVQPCSIHIRTARAGKSLQVYSVNTFASNRKNHPCTENWSKKNRKNPLFFIKAPASRFPALHGKQGK